MTTTTADDITDRVRERYAAAAAMASHGTRSSDAPCCDEACCGDAITDNLYTADETQDLPEKALLASLGCGNPTALVELKGGETVLDLGSGGGIDVLLSARRVGPTGFVYGVDMTDEMLALAQENKAKAGVTNVAFLKGRIEEIPLPANSVDVVISNCVINLAADKSLVLKDALRVLKPGGRFAVADVVTDGPVPDELRRNMEVWVGCIAGALDTDTYGRLLSEAGFEGVGIEITRRYTVAESGLDAATLPAGWEEADGKIASAFVRAVKPQSSAKVKPLPATSLAHMLADEPLADPIGIETFKAEVWAWADRIGVEAPEIHVRPMTRKWASRSSRGRLSFDARLLSQPRPFRGEVILHELLELLHRKVPDHGPLFTTLLRSHDERR